MEKGPHDAELTFSPDRRFLWDGTAWRQVGPDGRYYWNGGTWVPVPAAAAAAPPLDNRSPTKPVGVGLPAKRMGIGAKVAIGVGAGIVVLLVIAIVGSALGSGSKNTAASASVPPTPRPPASVPAGGAPASPSTGARTSAPAATATATPASTPTPTAPPTPAPTPNAPPAVILSIAGSGSKSTAKFDVPDQWDLVWSYNCANFGGPGNFQVDVRGGGGAFAGVNSLGAQGSGTEYNHQSDPGLYLEVNSECSWTIKVRGAAAGENGGANLDVKGDGTHTTQVFTVPDEWVMSYTFDCSAYGSAGNFQVSILTSDGAMTDNQDVNELATNGNATENYHTGGSLYLEINSECSWHVTAKPSG